MLMQISQYWVKGESEKLNYLWYNHEKMKRYLITVWKRFLATEDTIFEQTKAKWNSTAREQN